MGFIFIYSGFDLLEGNPSAEKSEQDSWGAVEALTVPLTEYKGLHMAGSDLRIQMLQIEQATQRVQSKGKPTCVTAAESLGDVFSSVLILNIIQ